MKWIVLDFGTSQIKALKIDTEGQKLQIEDFASWPNKPSNFKGLGHAEPAAWAEATIKLNELEWLRPEEDIVVTSALPSAYLETRYISFPFRNTKKIEKVLSFELEALIPFDIEEIQIRSRVLEGDGLKPTKKDAIVLTMAYKRETIKAFEAELRKFQLSLPPVTAEVLALSSLRQAISSDSLYGLLEIGHSKTQFLYLQKNGTILGARTFWWGGSAFIQKFMPLFNNDATAAEKAFHAFGSAESPAEQTAAYEAAVQMGVTELRQTLKAFQSAGLDFPKPFPVYILGKTARSPQLVPALEAGLRTEFDVQIRSFPIPSLFGKQIEGGASLMDVDAALPALSIALAQMRQHRGKIQNFSETSFQFQQNLKKLKTGSFTILRRVAFLLIMPILYGVLHYFVQTKENQIVLSNVSQMLKSAGISIPVEDSTDEIVEQLRLELANNRKKLAQMQKGAGPLTLLSEISAAIPSHLTIDTKDFHVTDSTVMITAETTNVDSVSRIVEALKTKFPKLKTGTPSPCAAKRECRSFTVEIEREKEL